MSKPEPDLEEILSFHPTPAFMDHPMRLLGNIAMSCLLWSGIIVIGWEIFRP